MYRCSFHESEFSQITVHREVLIGESPNTGLNYHVSH